VRQVELLADYASGLRQDDIACRRFLSLATVKIHLSEVRCRLGAKSLAHCCVIALDRGVIERSGEGDFKPSSEYQYPL
jgi:DNA-binding NarL/FixJ family response regulator